jgi:hypothetical protein
VKLLELSRDGLKRENDKLKLNKVEGMKEVPRFTLNTQNVLKSKVNLSLNSTNM